MEDNYLIHWGVKGMKWGVRRRLPDSSRKKQISPAEEAKSMSNEQLRKQSRRMQLEKRYLELAGPNSNNSRLNNVSAASQVGSNANAIAGNVHKSVIGQKNYEKSNAKNAYGAVGSAFNAIGKTADLAKQVKSANNKLKQNEIINKKLSEMSDDDLAKTVERLDLERNYASLKNEHVKRGKISVGEIISIAGTIVGIAAPAITTALSIASFVSKAKNKGGKVN